MKPDEQQFEELLARLIDDDLSGSGADELYLLSARSPERIQRLREALYFEGLLKQALHPEGSEEAFTGTVEARLRKEGFGSEPSERQFLDALSEMLDGPSGESGAEALFELAADSPERVRTIREELFVDDLLQQVEQPSRSEEAFVSAFETRLDAEEDSDQFVDQIGSRIVALEEEWDELESRRWGRATWSWAAAAAVVLTGVVLYFSQPEPATVARVSPVSESVQWEGRGNIRPELAAGTYALAAGTVELDLDGGTLLTIEGPAEFELVSGNEVRLNKGVAAAKIGDAPESFTLRTPNLMITEAEHSYGVDAREPEATEAIVFQGKTKILLTAADETRTLFGHEAVRAESDGDTQVLKDIPFIPVAFSQVWAPMSGVERVTGNGSVEVPGMEEVASRRSDKKVRVFLERDGVQLEDDIEVDTLEPGRFADANSGQGSTIRPEGEVRSYLVQVRPLDETGESSLEASFTFEGRIVGVIYSSDRLERSDELLRVASSTLDNIGQPERGLDGGAAGDRIMVSDDRHTLNLLLRGGDRDLVDHVRILVAAN